MTPFRARDLNPHYLPWIPMCCRFGIVHQRESNSSVTGVKPVSYLRDTRCPHLFVEIKAGDATFVISYSRFLFSFLSRFIFTLSWRKNRLVQESTTFYPALATPLIETPKLPYPMFCEIMWILWSTFLLFLYLFRLDRVLWQVLYHYRLWFFQAHTNSLWFVWAR